MALAQFLRTSYNIIALKSTANCCLPKRLQVNNNFHIHSDDQEKLVRWDHLKKVNFATDILNQSLTSCRYFCLLPWPFFSTFLWLPPSVVSSNIMIMFHKCSQSFGLSSLTWMGPWSWLLFPKLGQLIKANGVAYIWGPKF